MVVDTDVPADQTVKVTFVNSTNDGWFVVTKWNNTSVVEELYGGKDVASNDISILTVPAGDTGFTFEVHFTLSKINSVTTHSYKNIEIRYDLEPGKEYHIKGLSKSSGYFMKYELFVGIYDAADGTLLKELKIGEVE